jgi:hypothetical protein
VSAKEPIYGSHEINRDKVCKELFELALDLGVLQEVYKVFDIDVEGKGGCQWFGHGFGWINEVAGEQAGVGCIVFEAKTVEDAFYLIVPVAGAAAKAVQGAFEEPVFIVLCVRVANGRLDDCYLIWGKNALAEGVFAVALFECALALDGHADK